MQRPDLCMVGVRMHLKTACILEIKALCGKSRFQASQTRTSRRGCSQMLMMKLETA